MEKEYTIKEVSELFNITANKIRFYEAKGLLLPKRNEENEYRKYNIDDIMKLQSIILYRSIGMSVKDISEIFNNSQKSNLLNHFTMQWELINNQIDKLSAIRNAIGEIIDMIYENRNADMEKEILNSIKSTYELNEIKNNWKDKWDFDGWADVYDNFVHNDKSKLNMYKNYDEVLDTVHRIACENLSKDAEVLEIGVGTGNLAHKFIDDGINIIGIDQSRKMMDKAKEKYPNLKVRIGEFLKIPFNDKKFDVIVSTYAFHHLNDDEKAVAAKEMLRVLKEHGKIVIGDLMFDNKKSEQAIRSMLTKEQSEEVDDEFFSHIDYLKEVFNKLGKNIKKTKIDEINWIIEIE